MDTETKKEIEFLKQRVEKLEILEKALKNMSTFPFEIEQTLIGRGFLKFDSDIIYYGGVGGNAFPKIFVRYGNKKSLIDISNEPKEFIVNTGTDVCTSINHGFSDGHQVILYSTNTLPGGLDVPTSYWILNSTTNTFKLSIDGVNPVDITSSGIGTHYAQYFT